MSNIWVYKADGSLQCGEGRVIPLEIMRKDLESILPQGSIVQQEKRRLPLMIPALCGVPTGQVNAYELTPAGAYALFHSIVGPQGFAIWVWKKPLQASSDLNEAGLTFQAHDPDVPIPLSFVTGEDKEKTGAFVNLIASLTQAGAAPTTVADLVGRYCRCYKQGDMLTMDFWPERVNIELTEKSTIARIWFG